MTSEHWHFLLGFLVAGVLFLPDQIHAQRQMENLGRGLVALRTEPDRVFVGWRLLGTDPDSVAFHLYRATGDAPAVRLNDQPIADVTHFVDTEPTTDHETAYFVRAVVDGSEGEPGAPFTIKANAPVRPYLSIPLQTPEGCRPNDISVGDLDGDGEYELVVKMEMRPRDNSHAGMTGQTRLQAYKLNGELLWTIDLGRNIREGAHYTQFMVYDLDGNGRAEVACKTADGTVDGRGTIIGDPHANHRNADGHVLRGPEFFTIFDGLTGAALVTTNYFPARHPTKLDPSPAELAEIWGDGRGNRSDRYLACIAYLDGHRPSLVLCRGYYTRTALGAWNWRDGQLTQVWTFDSDDGTPGNQAYRGQGNHSIAVADVDGDGRDEIIYGGAVINHDGTGLYSTGLGHGDAQHTSDLDPTRPGLEIFSIHENPRHPHGIEMRDAHNGKILWSKPSSDVGRGLAIDIDPRHPGHECWASGQGLNGLFNARGEMISQRKPRSCNFAVWWDGDLLREILDRNVITKWNWEDSTETTLLLADGCVANNGTKANPALSADIFGDWREEVIWRTADDRELRIYTTTIPTQHRLYTLMHDPVYRLSVAWQNVGYNQPPHTGFFLGHGMEPPPRPNIVNAVTNDSRSQFERSDKSESKSESKKTRF